MKKILILLTATLLSFTTLSAGQGNGQGKGAMCASNNKQGLKHANPMPNLMRIVVANAELLDVTPEQMTAIKAWMKESKPKMKKMVKTVMSEEKRLMENALTTDDDSLKEAQLMLETRANIIAMKTKCRATLKGILSKKQYENVIKIYTSTR